MLKKFLLFFFFIFSGILLWQKTSISSQYYYNKAINLYNSERYVQSLPLFKKALSNSAKNTKYRIDYVKALSKSGKSYSVQKELYDIANSGTEDAAKDLAKSEATDLRRRLLVGVEDNYIFNAISGKEIVRWDMAKFPVKVYYQLPPDIPPYYKINIEKAFSDWSTRAGYLKFEKTDNKKNANIFITFKDYNKNDCQGRNCLFTAAYTEPVINSDSTLEKMNLTFYKTGPSKSSFSQREIYNTALHEIGHTLGIMGHSDNSSDIMYANSQRVNDLYSAYRTDLQKISMRDLKTLALLYRMAPTISNTKHLKNENFYYAPLILGSDEEVLQKKLVEMEKYIKNYPNFAAGYINISTVYEDLGEFDKAIQALDTAQNLAQTQDERYLIEYNRAVFYYNKHDFISALAYATKAKGIKQTPEIDTLINEIKTLHK